MGLILFIKSACVSKPKATLTQYIHTVPTHSRDPQSLVPEPIIKLPCLVNPADFECATKAALLLLLVLAPSPILVAQPPGSTRVDSIPHGTLAMQIRLRRNQPPNEREWIEEEAGDNGRTTENNIKFHGSKTTDVRSLLQIPVPQQLPKWKATHNCQNIRSSKWNYSPIIYSSRPPSISIRLGR